VPSSINTAGLASTTYVDSLFNSQELAIQGIETLANTTTGFDLQAPFYLTSYTGGNDTTYVNFGSSGPGTFSAVPNAPMFGHVGIVNGYEWIDGMIVNGASPYFQRIIEGPTFKSNTLNNSGSTNFTFSSAAGAQIATYSFDSNGFFAAGPNFATVSDPASFDYVYFPVSRTVLDSALYLWYTDGTGRWADPATLGDSSTKLHTYTPTTTALTIDIQNAEKSIERVDLTSSGSPLTLTVNNAFGSGTEVGFYTFHFTNGTDVDVVFPASFLNINDGTSVGTITISNGQRTAYYDGTNFWMEL